MTTSQLDLSELAIDRETAERPGLNLRGKRQVLSRYLIPAALIAGFLVIVAWASRDLVFPPRDVSVIPVRTTQQAMRASGTAMFNAAGWIEPRPTPIRVPGLAPGVVESLLVVEDQLVNAGEPVAELVKDDARLTWEMSLADQKLREAELVHARAALVAANTRHARPVHLQAKLAQAAASLATVQTELANLPFELKRAQSRLKFASNDYDRNVDARDSVSKREVDDARTVVETMQAMVNELELRDSSIKVEIRAMTMKRDALQEQLDLLIDEILDRDQAIAQVTMAEARLEQCLVAVAEAKLRLDRMTIRAPVDGRILLLVGHPGTRIGGTNLAMNESIDGSTVVTMYQPEKLQVKVDVRFEDIPQVSLGQTVRIDNPAIQSPLTGAVLFISSEADIQKNTLEVKVAIDSPPAVFKPEMLVDVTFLAPEIDPKDQPEEDSRIWRIYVPKNLVINVDGMTCVWIADRSARVARRVTVTLGDPGPDETVEITQGLNVSSRVITSPPENLKDGRRIKVTEESL